jgi:hypothetical protein
MSLHLSCLHHPIALVFVLLLLLLSYDCATVAADYVLGDTVSMLKRTEFAGKRTQWSDVPSNALPHFAKDSSVALNHLGDAIQFNAHKNLRLQFAVHTTPNSAFTSQQQTQPQLRTQWITITDGRRQLYATHLVFTLTRTQTQITSITYRAIYASAPASKKSLQEAIAKLSIQYEWNELQLTDDMNGVTMMITLATILLWLAIILSCCDSNRPDGNGSKASGSARYSAVPSG